MMIMTVVALKMSIMIIMIMILVALMVSIMMMMIMILVALMISIMMMMSDDRCNHAINSFLLVFHKTAQASALMLVDQCKLGFCGKNVFVWENFA